MMNEPYGTDRREDYELRQLVDRVLAEAARRTAPQVKRARPALTAPRHQRSPLRVQGYKLRGTCTRAT